MSQPARRDLLAVLLARPFSLAIFVFTLVVLGIFSLFRLPVALLPSLERPHLDIELEGRRLSRDQWLEEIVEPLERRLSPLPGVVQVASHIDDGRALLRLEGEWQADRERLIVEVERVLGAMPSGRLEQATTRAAPPDARPVLRLALLAPEGAPSDLAALTTFADGVLLPALGRLPGAGELRRRGGVRRVLQIEPRFADLAAHGLTTSELASRLKGTGRREAVGQVRQGGDRRPLFLSQPIGSLDDLARLGLGEGLRLEGVADLRPQNLPDGSLAFFRDEVAVLIDVYRAPGANAVRLAHQGRQLLERLAAVPTRQNRIELLDDTSAEVVDSLGGLLLSLLLGLLLGGLILRLGLGRWRPTAALVVVVPASILSSFAGFYAFGVPLDVVSLAGLALASGMLVDSSIVVLEAIATARAAGATDPRLEGVRQVALPLLASFVTTAVVFLPLLYLEGLARAFFGAQAFAIATSLGLSLVFSLTLTPLLCGRGGQGALDLGEGGARFAADAYQRRLAAALARKTPWLLATLLLLAGGITALVLLPKALMPDGLRRHLTIELELGGADQEARHETLATFAGRIAAAAPAIPFEVELTLPTAAGAQYGSSAARQPFTEEGRGKARLTFENQAALVAAEPAISAAASSVPGLHAELHRERGALAAFADELGAGLELEILAQSESRAAALAAETQKLLLSRNFPNTLKRVAARQALELRYDATRQSEERAAVEKEVSSLLGGEVLGELELSGEAGELRLAPPPGSRLELLPIAWISGNAGAGEERRLLPLGAFAHFEEIAKAPPLERKSGHSSRLLRVAAGLAQRDEIAALVAAVPRAQGEQIQLVGRSRELKKAFSQLELALSLGLLLVFLTIAALYESLRLPLVVLATVPCALAGAFLTLYFAGSTLDVFSFLGLLLLAGIVVNNAIVLLDRAESWRRAGAESAAKAVELAAAERYRPILMTTATTLLGLLPMALIGGEGAELRRSLALALAGGLATSWLAVLFVLPLLYQSFFDRPEAR